MKLFIKFILIASIVLNAAFVYKLKNKILTRLNLIRQAKVSQKKTIQPKNDPVMVYCSFNNVTRLKPSALSPTNVLSDSLIIPTGIYQIAGITYDLRKEGLYRFMFPGVLNKQRIVYKKDVDKLLSSISWIATHGNSDDKLTITSLMSKASKSKLVITCGVVSTFAKKVLDKLAIKSRIVVGMTSGKYNDYDNGHTLLEVYRPKYNKWVVYDLDNNCYMADRGTPLSFLEVSHYVRTNKAFNFIKLSEDTKLGEAFKSSGGYDYSFYSEYIVVNNKSLRSWYKRVLQIPLIGDQSFYYFHSDSQTAQRLMKYSPQYKRIKNSREYLQRFYPENNQQKKLTRYLYQIK